MSGSDSAPGNALDAGDTYKCSDSLFLSSRELLRVQSESTGISVYDHLVEVVSHILDKKPANAADIFENISTQVKCSRFNVGICDAPLGFKKAIDNTILEKEVEALSNRLQATSKPGEEEGGEEPTGQIPDLLDILRLLEWTGNTLSREEGYVLLLSIRRLVAKVGLRSARFWGKIHATNTSYYIVEGEGAANISASDESSAENGQESSQLKAEVADFETKKITASELDKFPGPKRAPKMKTAAEESAGCNKYCYFVTTELGSEWTQLPDVTPEQITVSKKIRKYFTGDIEAKLNSYPKFPGGAEKHYLRAQIARITAATVVCPAGYYQFDQEGGDEENGDANFNIIVNTENEVMPNDSMLSLENWVHQMPHILPQGRTTFTKPERLPATGASADGEGGGADGDEGKDADDEDEEASSDAEGEYEDGNSGESGNATRGSSNGAEEEEEIDPEDERVKIIPLLSPIAQDREMSAHVAAWTVGSCMMLQGRKQNGVHVRSNRWPGAHAVYDSGRFASVYFGDGQKELNGEPHTLPPLPKFMAEYREPLRKKNSGADENNSSISGEAQQASDMKEESDPTVEEEKAHEQRLREREIDNAPDEQDDDDANDDDGKNGNGDNGE